jgi:hypothetical protein
MDLVTDRFRAAPDRPLELRTVVGPPLVVHVRALRLDINSAASVAEIELELDGSAYGRCLDEGHLGLDAPGRGPGPEPELGRPITIVARLRAYLTDQVAAEPEPMAALLERLFAPPAAFASADAWRALDVTQEVEELGVAMGFRTVWAGEGSAQ